MYNPKELIQLNKNKSCLWFSICTLERKCAEVNVQKQEFAKDYHTCLNFQMRFFFSLKVFFFKKREPILEPSLICTGKKRTHSQLLYFGQQCAVYRK